MNLKSTNLVEITYKLSENCDYYKGKIIKNNNKGATSKKALILFFLSAFFRLISKGIPSVVKICFVSELINKKGGYK